MQPSESFSVIKISVLTILFHILLLSTTNGLAEESGKIFQWPDGIRAAVNLAYDDALDSQL